MQYCEKCVAKNRNGDFFVMTLQMFCGTFHQRERERAMLQTSCGAERVNGISSETPSRVVFEGGCGSW